MTNTQEQKSSSRRSFLSAAASGLTLTFLIPDFTRIDEALGASGTQVNAWLNVAIDETITLTVGSSEMGQGSFTGLAQVVAEELMVDFSRVRSVQGSPNMTSPVPVGASINTVGSGVIRGNFWKMRDAGAIAREMLVKAAMNQRADQVRTNFTVANGIVTHTPTRSTLSYGSLAAAAALLPPPATAPLVPDNEFRIIGKTVPRQDIPSKVDGSAKYGLDVQVPGMVYAVVKHCPTLGGTMSTKPSTPSGMLAVVPLSVFAGTGRGTEVTGAVNAIAVVGNQHPPLVRRKCKHLRIGLPVQRSLLRKFEINVLIAPENSIHDGPFQIHIGEKQVDHRLLESIWTRASSIRACKSASTSVALLASSSHLPFNSAKYAAVSRAWLR